MKRPQSPADKHVRRAHRRLTAGRLAEARAEAEAALAMAPGHEGAEGALAWVEAKEGDVAGASARLRRCIAANPESLDPRWVLCRILRDAGEIAAAVELLEASIAALPDALWLHEDLAHVLAAHVKDPSRALEAIDRGLGRAGSAAGSSIGLFEQLTKIIVEALATDDRERAERGLVVLAAHARAGAALLACARSLWARAPLASVLIALDARPTFDEGPRGEAIVVALALRIARGLLAIGTEVALRLAYLICERVRYEDYDGRLAGLAPRIQRRLDASDYDIRRAAERALRPFHRRRLLEAPNDGGAWAGLAECLDLSDGEGALEAALEGVERAPESRAPARVAIRLLVRQKRVGDAKAIAERHASRAPGDPWIWIQLGNALRYTPFVDPALNAYEAAAALGSADGAREVMELAAQHDLWELYEEADRERLTALARSDKLAVAEDTEADDDDDDDAAGEAEKAPRDVAPEKAPRDVAPEEGPEPEVPSVPAGIVLRPRFSTTLGDFEAGKAFAARLSDDGPALLVTAQHLFGPAGGAPRAIGGEEMPSVVLGVRAADAFEGAPVVTAGPALHVPYASGNRERADVAAFRILTPDRARTAPLAEMRSFHGDEVWLASPLRGDREGAPRLHRGRVTESDDDLLSFRFDRGDLVLGGASGAPILDRRGHVVGVLVRYSEVYGGGLVGCALAAPALRSALEDALDPGRSEVGSMTSRRDISVCIHIKTLATLTEDQAERVVAGVDRDTGELCSSLNARALRVTLDYPLERAHEVTIEAGDLGRLRLGGVLWRVARAYEEIYRDPSAHGVWGHGLSDLYLEGIVIEGDRAHLLVGS